VMPAASNATFVPLPIATPTSVGGWL
jgi:hypothetical protein